MTKKSNQRTNSAPSVTWPPPQEILNSVQRVAITVERLKLTLREAAVAHLVSLGYCNKDIARFLRMSPRTCQAHLRSVYLKLRIPGRGALSFVVGDVLNDLGRKD